MINYITFGAAPLFASFNGQSLHISNTVPSPQHLGDIVILQSDQDTADAAKASLFMLRNVKATSMKPVFLTHETATGTMLLSDGLLKDPKNALFVERKITENLKKLPASIMDMGDAFRLLAFMYSRAAELQPLVNVNSSYFYTYPLAEAFMTEPGQDVMHWILDLHSRKLLDPANLVDRIRHCPRCWGSKLNYVDVCEACGSLNIERHTFLHCFACGHVDREEDFMTENGLVCPNCHTRLRGIGADYDRTLESYQCQDCKTRQLEPAVIARCMSCGTKSDPDELQPQAITTFKYSKLAENSLLLGNLEALMSGFNILDFVEFEQFRGILDWFMRMFRRYPEQPFALLVARMPNLAGQARSMGQDKTMELVNTLARRFKDLLRDTDLVSRSEQTTLWALLSRVTPGGTRIVYERIKNKLQGIELSDGTKLQVQFQYWVPEKDKLPKTPDQLLSQLLLSLDVEQ